MKPVLQVALDVMRLKCAIAGSIIADIVLDYIKVGAHESSETESSKTNDIEGAAVETKKAMKNRKVDKIITKKHTDEGLFEAFSKVSACNISDAYHKKT